jgi:hypothetical protein
MVSEITSDWCLKVMSNQPDRFALSIVDNFSLPAPDQTAQVARVASDEGTAVFVCRTQEGVDVARARRPFAGAADGYAFFASPDLQPVLRAISAGRAPASVSGGARLAPEIALGGVSLAGGGLPEYLDLFLKVERPPLLDYHVRVRYRDATTGDVSFERAAAPIYGVHPSREWAVGEVVSERVYFPFTADLAPGRYRIEIELAPAAGGPAAPAAGETVHVGPVWVVLSKRDALRAILEGESRDWRLLLQVLANL